MSDGNLTASASGAAPASATGGGAHAGRRDACLALLVPVLLFLAVYGRCLALPLTFADDIIHVNAVQKSPPWACWHSEWKQGVYSFYRPVVLTAVWASWTIHGYRAWGYHLHMLVFGTALICLSCLLLRRLSGSWLGGAAGAAFIALNPQAHNVFCWIAESHQGLLSGLFFVGSLLAYLRYLDRPRWPWWALAWACAWLAIAAKEPALAVLPALLLVGWAAGRPGRTRAALVLVLTVAATYGAMRWQALGTLSGKYLASENRALLTADLGDVFVSDLPPGRQRAYYAYTVGANFLGTFVPDLFAGNGRLRSELFTQPRANATKLTAALLEVAAMGAVLAWAARRGWRTALWGAGVAAAVACVMFVIYRPRSHFIGLIGCAALVAAAVGQARSARQAALRKAALWALLLAMGAWFAWADVRYVGSWKAELQATNVLTTPPPGDPRPLDDAFRREIHRRYPPR